MNTTEEQAFLKSVAMRIQIFRKRRGMLQKDLAALLGVSRSTIAMIEANKCSVSISRLLQMSKVLGVDIDEFFDFAKLPCRKCLHTKNILLEIIRDIHKGVKDEWS